MNKNFLKFFTIALIALMAAGSFYLPQTGQAADPQVSITAVGDVMLGRQVADQIAKQGKNYPFAKLAGRLGSADITFGNLESPLSDEGKALKNKSVVFRGDPAMATVLAQTGFDIMNLANNHAMDYGNPALIETINVLDQNNVKHIGAGSNLTEARKAVIITKNGLRIGFLAYTDVDFYNFGYNKYSFAGTSSSYGVAPMDRTMILKDLAALEPLVDATVVSMHWGKEYDYSANTAEIRLAHDMIDAGAELILGHHPHRLQGLEKYKNGLIAYSMGNFVFDQRSMLYMRRSMILDVKLAPQKVTAATVTPVFITNCQPAILTGSDANSLLKTIAGYCTKLNTSTSIQNEKLVINMN